ncbi:unnamed protein product [Hapterophycus canaliculatus]
MTITEASPVPTLFSALKKGGFNMDDLQGGSTKHTDDTGAWDGVDLVSAPCLQVHAVRNVTGGRSTYLEGGERSINMDGQQTQDVHDRRKTAHKAVRPSTPPGLLVYQPCLRVKVADDVPSELQTLPRILGTQANRLERTSPPGLAVPQPSSEAQEETYENSAKTRLKVGLSLAQLSPKRPKGKRNSGPGARALNNRNSHTFRENPSAPRSGQDITCKPVGRATPYGKAWYVNPELWGLESSPQPEHVALDQEKDSAEGAKQLLAHTKSMKAAIPGLFSAMRFVAYIRQQGVRMPAHLESTDHAMKADKARVGEIRRSTASREDQYGSEYEVPHENEERTGVSATAPGKVWRARVNAQPLC